MAHDEQDSKREGPEAAQPVDLVVHNGRITTLDADDRCVQAAAVRGGRIVALGEDQTVLALAGPHTRLVDAAGRRVVPGLIDGHAHMDREGLKEALPSLAGCRSIDDVLQRIEALARERPPGEWIVTMPIGEPPFYQGVPGNLRENRFPTRQELDRVAPLHPVYIRAIWGHWRNTLPLVSIANTRALALAGISRDSMPPAPSIQIDKALDSGEPTGIFYEFTYKPLVEKTLMNCIPRFDLDDRITGLRRSMQIYNGFGTTSVFEGHGIAGEVFAAYQRLREEGPLPVRSVLMFSPAWSDTQPEAVRDLLLDWGRWLAGRGLGDAWLRMGGLYLESDRSEENRLRALCGPYTGWAGFNFDCALPEKVMLELMVEAARNGIRIGSFSPGILDLYEQVDRRAPIAGQRWLIEHVGQFDREQIKRIRDLGLVLQAYSSKWIGQDGEALRERLGESRVHQVLPMRDLLDAGIHVSLATDNVPPTLFVPIAQVVGRLTDAGRPLAPEQALTPLEALACASREGAWLSFEEKDKGTLELGKLADMAILSADPLCAPVEQIADIHSVLTITGGHIVHDASSTG